MIEDSNSGARHDEWDVESQQIHLDNDSLYVSVRAQVDGPVTVSVYRDAPLSQKVDDMTEVFQGVIDLDSGRLKVSDSDDHAVLTVDATKGSHLLTVLVDQLPWVERVVVILANDR